MHNFLYLVTALPLAFTIFLIFRHILKVEEWYYFDFVTVLVPGMLYAVMDFKRLDKLFGISKSLGNLAEPVLIGIGCGVGFLFRSILARIYPNYSRKISFFSILAMFTLTIGVYFFTPALPE